VAEVFVRQQNLETVDVTFSVIPLPERIAGQLVYSHRVCVRLWASGRDLMEVTYLVQERLVWAMIDATSTIVGVEKLWTDSIPFETSMSRNDDPVAAYKKRLSSAREVAVLQRALRIPTPTCPEPIALGGVRMTSGFLSAVARPSLRGHVLRWLALSAGDASASRKRSSSDARPSKKG
jgi:hypothetical protein